MKYIDILKKFDNAIITESLKLKKIYEQLCDGEECDNNEDDVESQEETPPENTDEKTGSEKKLLSVEEFFKTQDDEQDNTEVTETEDESDDTSDSEDTSDSDEFVEEPDTEEPETEKPETEEATDVKDEESAEDTKDKANEISAKDFFELTNEDDDCKSDDVEAPVPTEEPSDDAEVTDDEVSDADIGLAKEELSTKEYFGDVWETEDASETSTEPEIKDEESKKDEMVDSENTEEMTDDEIEAQQLQESIQHISAFVKANKKLFIK